MVYTIGRDTECATSPTIKHLPHTVKAVGVNGAVRALQNTGESGYACPGIESVPRNIKENLIKLPDGLQERIPETQLADTTTESIWMP